jgi:hypothetical protein
VGIAPGAEAERSTTSGARALSGGGTTILSNHCKFGGHILHYAPFLESNSYGACVIFGSCCSEQAE